MIGVANFPHLIRHFGPRWLAYRTAYVLRRRLGLLRFQMPNRPWRPLGEFLANETLADPDGYLSYRRNDAPPFFFKPDAREHYRAHLTGWDRDDRTPIAVAEDLGSGTLLYYSHIPVAADFPPHWHRDPFTGSEAPAERHWTEIADFGQSDIKTIWEPSRFSFVYALVRAYWRTADERYPELFWQLVGDWRVHNPPQQGPNWKCGQETSFRVMAWLFGLYGFLESEVTTGERVTTLAAMIAASGERIEANLGYALSQQNNHGISEGMGLWTIGTFFPEFERAQQWEVRGRRVLEALGRDLIYDDGAFSQHSLNYQRLMLHDYVWSLRLAEIIGRPFSRALHERVARSGSFLAALQFGSEGEVPRYGQNDGALILPLNNCDYQDYRPVTQAVHYLTTGNHLYPHGPWDEDLLWLFGETALDAPLLAVERQELRAETSGYYTFLSGESAVFVRCGTLHHRPSQADLLHVDVWWRGQNLALDPGTYSYNAPDPWHNPLAETQYHNTVIVECASQMERVGRFLWLPWVTGTVRSIRRSEQGYLAYWEGEHDGYQRLKAPVTYKRAIIGLGEAHWLVLDRLDSTADHDYRLHWLLADLPFEWNEQEKALTLKSSETSYRVQIGAVDAVPRTSVVRGDPRSPRGWYAPYYQDRQPAISLDASLRSRSALFWTWFGPGAATVSADSSRLSIATHSSSFTVQLDEIGRETLVARLTATQDVADTLNLAL